MSSFAPLQRQTDSTHHGSYPTRFDNKAAVKKQTPRPEGEVKDNGPRKFAMGTYDASTGTYAVATGDAIYGIAVRFNVAPSVLMSMNSLDQKSVIHPNTVLSIKKALPGQQETKQADTFYDSSLAENNKKFASPDATLNTVGTTSNLVNRPVTGDMSHIGKKPVHSCGPTKPSVSKPYSGPIQPYDVAEHNGEMVYGESNASESFKVGDYELLPNYVHDENGKALLSHYTASVWVNDLSFEKPRIDGSKHDGPFNQPRVNIDIPRIDWVIPANQLEHFKSNVKSYQRAANVLFGSQTHLSESSIKAWNGNFMGAEGTMLMEHWTNPGDWVAGATIFAGGMEEPAQTVKLPETSPKFDPQKPELMKKNMTVPASQNGYAPNFSGTPYLYPVKNEELNIVKIKMTGSYGADFEDANKAANLKETPDGYMWHHQDDYIPKTGETTMQLVDKRVHRATIPHTGSVKQYEIQHNTNYR